MIVHPALPQLLLLARSVTITACIAMLVVATRRRR
jgi:hypothetical protein